MYAALNRLWQSTEVNRAVTSSGYPSAAMIVIDFPIHKARPPVAHEAVLGEDPEGHRFQGTNMEAAFTIHRMIFNGMRMGRLRESPDALRCVLIYAMDQHFGPERVIWAIQQFEAVYGIDPRGFVEHVAAYLD